MNTLKPDNTTIKIYSASWCGPCKMAKRFLTENGFTLHTSFNDTIKHNPNFICYVSK